jgi:histidyl-tRNA synthetase
MLGGKPAPGIGWGMGIERVLDLVAELGLGPPPALPDIYCILPDAAAAPVALSVAESLRSHGLSVLMHAASAEGQGSMKSQFRRADASGARFALVFGAQELAAGSVSVKPLRDVQAAQTTHLLADLPQWAAGLRAA